MLLLKTGATRNSDEISNLIPATIDGMVLDVPNEAISVRGLPPQRLENHHLQRGRVRIRGSSLES